MVRLRVGVTAKLMAGVGVMLLLAILCGAIAIYALMGVRQDFTATAERDIPMMLAAASLRDQANAVLSNVPQLVMATEQFRREAVSFRVSDRLDAIGELIDDLESRGMSTANTVRLRAISDDLKLSLNALDGALEQRLVARDGLRHAFVGLWELEQKSAEEGAELVAGLDQEAKGLLGPSGE